MPRQHRASAPGRPQRGTSLPQRLLAVLSALVLPLLTITACGTEGPVVVEVFTTTTVATTASISSTVGSPTSTSAAAPSPAAVPVTPASAPSCGVYGFTGATGTENARCLDKQISSCGDPSLHEFGTTFFTDGSSGWTQTCQDRMQAEFVPRTPVTTFDQDAYNRQFEEEYWRTNPRPTFDPDSADGYGPDQTLPPACLRLEGVDC